MKKKYAALASALPASVLGIWFLPAPGHACARVATELAISVAPCPTHPQPAHSDLCMQEGSELRDGESGDSRVSSGLAAGSRSREASDLPPPRPKTPQSLILTADTTVDGGPACERSRRLVEAELAAHRDHSRDHALEMYAGAAAARHQFDLAATACAMFLEEFGSGHAESGRMALRSAECLFPFDPDRKEVVQEAGNVHFEGGWVAGQASTPDRLQQAITACRLAARLASDDRASGKAMIRLGWLHRLRQDWDESTRVFDECADRLKAKRPGVDALRLSAENLAWVGRPQEAAARLRQLAECITHGPRRNAILRRIEALEAAARRSADWLEDPVASFRQEIDRRVPGTSLAGVYHDVMLWLRHAGEGDALLRIAEWVAEQPDWPTSLRLEAFTEQAAVLAGRTNPTQADYLRAAEALQKASEMADSPDRAVSVTLWRSQILSRAGNAAASDTALIEAEATAGDDARLLALVLNSRIEILIERGDLKGARVAFSHLAAFFPDSDAAQTLAQRFPTLAKESH